MKQDGYQVSRPSDSCLRFHSTVIVKPANARQGDGRSGEQIYQDGCAMGDGIDVLL